MPKLQENNGQYFITLPKELVRVKKWEKGKELLLMFNERGNVEVREV